MTSDHLLKLLTKLNENKASLEEISQLENWYASFRGEKNWLEEGTPETNRVKKELWEQIDRTLNIYEQASEFSKTIPTARQPKRIFLYRSVTAVLLFLFMGGFVYFSVRQLGHHSQNDKIIAEAPGAVLTLADGRIIKLDSLHEGTFLMRSGEKITVHNGQLVYAVSATTGSTVPQYNIISIPKGRQYLLMLPDGSKVSLNAASSLRFPTAFAPDTRVVSLTGEAYFEVMKNPHWPFMVEAGDIHVQVFGTSFNIMAYRDEGTIKTTLKTGSVGISKNNKTTFIKPGEMGSYTPGTGSIRVSQANVEQELAWKQGEFRFYETNISAIMRQIARWYDVDIVYDGDFSGVVLSGIISRKENVLQLLDALSITSNVYFKMKDKTISVLHK